MAGRGILKRVMFCITCTGLCCLAAPGADAADKSRVLQPIPPAYHQIARENGIPAEALYSVSLAETALRLPHGVRPWPWTLNVAGKGYRYNTRQEAYDALMAFMRRYPLKRIDVGVAQVNLGWNGRYFSNYREALDPYTNLRVAARILKACYESSPGSWIQAAGCYHHPAGGKPASIYKAIVKRKLATLDLSAPAPVPGLLAVQVPASPRQVSVPALKWIEPKESCQ